MERKQILVLQKWYTPGFHACARRLTHPALAVAPLASFNFLNIPCIVLRHLRTLQVKTHFPNMALTLVRRATADLPKNTYLFRCDPKYTKLEIKEYLQKVYNVTVANVSTINSLGTSRAGRCCFCPPPRVCPLLVFACHAGKLRRSGMHTYKQSDFKKVYVRIAEDAPAAKAASLERA